MIGKPGTERCAQRADHAVAGVEHRCARQAAGLVGMRQARHRVARQRGVGGDDAVDAVALQRGGDERRSAPRPGRARSSRTSARAAMPLRPVLRGAACNAPSRASSAASLCSARRFFVFGLRDVDRHVVGVRVDAVQAEQVVVGGALDRRARRSCRCSARRCRRAARKLRARCTLARKASRPSLLKPRRLISACCAGRRNMRGLGLPGWALRRDRADLDEAEAHRAQAVDAAAVLVQPGGQADAVRESAGRPASPGRRRGPATTGTCAGVFCSRAIASSVSSCAGSGSRPNRKGRVRA